MKKVLGVVIALAMVASCFAGFSVSADDSDFVIEGTTLVKYVGRDEHVVIPDGITMIGQGAFGKCRSLKSLDIPGSVATIGSEAFFLCDSLETVNISEGVKRIEEWAFVQCLSLKFVSIPNSVTAIGYYAFGSCRSLEKINVSLDNEHYSSEDGVLFNKDKTILVEYPEGKVGSTYVIPNSVITIGGGAFSACDSLKVMNIPSSVTAIEYEAFYSCTLLESVSIPNSVTTIGLGAFQLCSSLESISIPNGVKTIERATFNLCSSLKSVSIPNSVKTICGYAFTNCSSLKSLYIPVGVTEIEPNVYPLPVFGEVTTLKVIEGSYAHTWAVENEQPFDLFLVSSFDSMQDVFDILRIVVSGLPISAEQIAVADLNGDNKLTAADALAAMKIVMNK